MVKDSPRNNFFPEKNTNIFLLISSFVLGLTIEFYQIPKNFVFVLVIFSLIGCYLKKKENFKRGVVFSLLTVIWIISLNLLKINRLGQSQEFIETLKTHLEILVNIEKVEPYYKGYIISAYNQELGNILIRTKQLSFKPGETCLLWVKYKQPGEYLNPFSYSRKEILYIKGYEGEFEVLEDLPHVCKETKRFFLEKLRFKLFSFSEALDPLEKGLFQTLVLGVEYNLPQELRERLKNQGLYHQLAISGFNLGIIFGFVYFISYFLLRYTPVIKLGYPLQNISYVVSLPFAFIILLFSGFCPSALRAFVFLCLYVFAKLIFKRTSSLMILMLTAFILLLKDPVLMVNLSFQLSFLSTFGLLLGDRLFKIFAFKNSLEKIDKNTLKYYFFITFLWIFYSLFLSSIISFLIFPLILYINGTFPLFTPINNIIATFFWSFIFIPGSILSAFLVFLNENLAKYLIEIVTIIFKIYSKIPFFEENISFSLPCNLVFLFYLFLFICIVLKFLYRFNLIFFILGIFFLIVIYLGYKNVFYVTILDVGRANAFVIKSQEKVILIDTGPNYQDKTEFNWTKFYVEPVLRKLGVKMIDFLFISHPDVDHAGGYNHIKKSFFVKEAITGKFRPEDWEKISPLYSLSEVENIQGIRLNQMEMLLLPGKKEYLEKSINRESLVLYVEYKGLTLLFPGDIDVDRFYRMKIEEVVLPVEVLISPHHGSRYGLNEEILEWLRPKVVITSGRGPYHPHPDFLKILKQKGLFHFSTSEKGAIFIFPKKEYFLVCCEVERKKNFWARIFFPLVPYYLEETWCSKFYYHKV